MKHYVTVRVQHLRAQYQRTVLRTLLMLLAALPLTQALAKEAATPIRTYFDDFAAQWVRFNPDLATASRYFSGAEQQALERQMTPQTREWRLQRIALARKGIEGLKRFDRSSLSQADRVSAELMEWQLNAVVRERPYMDYWFPLEQFGGTNVNLVESLTLRHPLATPQDAQNYLARLDLVADRMNEAIAEARRIAGLKLLPPRFIVQATLAKMQTFSDVPAAQNPLVTAFATRIASIAALPAAEREALQARATKLVGDEVYPAWRTAIALLESLLPQTTDDAGLWRYKKGAEVYAYALERFTTTKLTADQIHEIGLKQVARIEAEMDRILKSIGRTEGTVRERTEKLENDLRYPDVTSDATRALVMQDIDGLIKDAIVRSQTLFSQQPKTPVVAQPFPRFREASAAANYNRAPFDGSRPAVFQMPLRPQRMTKFGLRTLVYHETVPGHHFQIALEAENPDLPRFRQSRALGGISALSEGWALYAERLVAESGWYDGDPEGLLGQLSAELWRARRLVVDTGLHAKHWTRQQAIDYGIEASEIERYVVNPGQACSYMIGQLEILSIRDRTRAALGDKFSPKDFHRTVLDTGTVPLELLKREVERYTQSAQSATR